MNDATFLLVVGLLLALFWIGVQDAAIQELRRLVDRLQKEIQEKTR